MSNISVNLKVIEVHAPAVARATKQPVTHVLGGLNLLWHRCWSTKKDTISRTGLAGIFGPDELDRMIASLIDEEFLEALGGDTWRIRGADLYLRIRESRSKGGKAASGNLKRGTQMPSPRPSPSPEPPESQPRHVPGSSRESAGSQPGEVPRLVPGSTPITDHRSPITDHQAAAAGREIVDGDGFWRAAQDKRVAAGLQRERLPHPRQLSAWFAEALLEEGVTVEKLLLGFEAFLADPWWRNEADKPCSWGGWINQWRDFVTKATAPTVPARKRSTTAEAPDWSGVKSEEVQL